MSKASQPVYSSQVISTFGTSFWIEGDSAADYILHPVFLRYAMLCIGIYALLDQGTESQLLIGWQFPLMWLTMAMVIIVGLLVLGAFTLQLRRRGWIRRLYTPFIMLPIVIITDLTAQGVIQVLQLADWKPLPQTLMDMTRDMLVVLLFDILHVQFVVPNHPLASTLPPGEQAARHLDRAKDASAETWARTTVATGSEPAAVAPAAPMDEGGDAPAAAERSLVQIADRSFAITEIQSVRTEDHYLNVVTRTGRNMLRAKLSEITALHDGRHGVQINRSQWVAFDAIETVSDEENGQITLHLANGESAVVSRTRRLMFLQLYNTQRSQPT